LTYSEKNKALKPNVGVALDRTDVAKILTQIKEEVEFHQGCAAEIKTELEKLTGTACTELIKVKELKRQVESLMENKDDGAGETWKRELDRELEKLSIIKRLLEASLPSVVQKPEVLPASSAADGKKRILVVDDDLTTVKIIAHFLEKENYEVSSSLSGIEGLKKAFRESPDLILLDIMMPDLNGFQFLSVFRKDQENARVPILILSSLAEETDVLKGLDVGAVDYITKPFSPQVLMAKIKKSLASGP
jgi:CheY-like chemotaxis protein